MVAYRDDEGACPGPPARRDHQLAPFVAPEWWFLPDGRPIELGLVLYGGEALDGTALDDLWVYTAVGHDAPGELRPVDDCPWVLLSDAATGGSGVAGGLLHQDGDGFRLVGGREQAAGWLDARLGSPEAKGTETPLAVWIGRDGASDGVVVRGYTKGGLVVLSPFGPAGQDTASDPASTLRMLDGTATHELAHVSLSRRVFFDDPAGGPSTEWFNEAAPVVLSLQRVPGYDPHALYDGLARRVSAWTSTGAGRPEIRDLTRSLDLSEENLRTRLWFARGYLVGPYLLAQNLALRDPVGATGAWNALRDDILAQRRNQRPVSQVELAGWLEEPGTPTLGFVATRVAGGLPGEPLLALHVLDHPTSGDLLAEVVQAQGSLTAAGGTPFAVFDAVPYAVGCANDADGTVLFGPPPFLDCDVGGVGAVTAGHVLTTATEALTFTPRAATDTSGAWFALLAGPQQLPGVTGWYGLLDGTSPPVPYRRPPSNPPPARAAQRTRELVDLLCSLQPRDRVPRAGRRRRRLRPVRRLRGRRRRPPPRRPRPVGPRRDVVGVVRRP